MSKSPLENVLCSYRYDPMDKSIELTPAHQAGRQRFYCNNRLSSEIQGSSKRSIFQHDSQILAQQHHRDGKIGIALLATDRQRSVLNALDASQPNPLAYTAYGHCPSEDGSRSLIGFTGEAPDQVTGHYHLGNGYRQYNPVVMRFNSPDSWSPFGKGGLNAYAYCGADPINRSDPSGHSPLFFIGLGLAAAGTITTLVAALTKEKVLRAVGLALFGIGSAIVGFDRFRSPQIANRASTSSSSNPLPNTTNSPQPSTIPMKGSPPASTPNSPGAASRQLRSTSENQTGRNALNENVNSGGQSPGTSPLPTNSSSGQSNTNYMEKRTPSFERGSALILQKRATIRNSTMN
ncbi:MULTISPECIES: RHS repeat-associated core domain-containing protein [unclassified Pseudomonas]|uniref:RHS repeat-associated core domain-containing protein n=1 Tax=unclassified Pseudomonas TaxID=196821 RepID=UPI001CBEF613|nr:MULTISPECIES: RHS repeat-associated core domain-containing protein [unclassified Pseudomonas]